MRDPRTSAPRPETEAAAAHGMEPGPGCSGSPELLHLRCMWQPLGRWGMSEFFPQTHEQVEQSVSFYSFLVRGSGPVCTAPQGSCHRLRAGRTWRARVHVTQGLCASSSSSGEDTKLRGPLQNDACEPAVVGQARPPSTLGGQGRRTASSSPAGQLSKALSQVKK